MQLFEVFAAFRSIFPLGLYAKKQQQQQASPPVVVFI
jgi:hypothetical protein